MKNTKINILIILAILARKFQIVKEMKDCDFYIMNAQGMDDYSFHEKGSITLLR